MPSHHLIYSLHVGPRADPLGEFCVGLCHGGGRLRHDQQVLRGVPGRTVGGKETEVGTCSGKFRVAQIMSLSCRSCRYYGGNEFIDMAETLCQVRIASHITHQPMLLCTGRFPELITSGRAPLSSLFPPAISSLCSEPRPGGIQAGPGQVGRQRAVAVRLACKLPGVWQTCRNDLL